MNMATMKMEALLNQSGERHKALADLTQNLFLAVEQEREGRNKPKGPKLHLLFATEHFWTLELRLPLSSQIQQHNLNTHHHTSCILNA
jgi:hypothetical protein